LAGDWNPHRQALGFAWVDIGQPIRGQRSSVELYDNPGGDGITAHFQIEGSTAKGTRDFHFVPMAGELRLNEQPLPVPLEAKKTFNQGKVQPGNGSGVMLRPLPS